MNIAWTCKEMLYFVERDGNGIITQDPVPNVIAQTMNTSGLSIWEKFSEIVVRKNKLVVTVFL